MTHPSPPSSSEPPGFALLHRGVRRWVWEQRWPSLRPIQEQAIEPVLGGRADVLLAAATASGKTEAVFLPVCSVLAHAAERGEATGIQAVYLSPLKALINDQHERLGDLCSRIGVRVTPWHGDVGAPHKDRVRNDPSGILLITPESLEAMFVLRGSSLPSLFANLRYVVIDELHAFPGTARGAQLRSLVHRLERVAGRKVARIGLSATLADLRSAAEFLRPGGGDRVVLVEDKGAGKDLLLQVRAYVDDQRGAAAGRACAAIADHVYTTLRTGHNMVFTNSRSAVEDYTGSLSARARQERVSDPFIPHHGSLSAELRARAEERLKSRSSPATVVCTSTLELGIDVGWVDAVAQIGAPSTVAGLRQRLGRSGRGKAPAKLYVYVAEQSLPESPVERLRTELVQTAAMVDLLLGRWFEPPALETPHFSTLVQQVLSVLAQYSGATAARLYTVLCRDGAFRGVDEETFAALLRALGENGLISQERGSGLLLPGPVGERLLNHYTFYAAFDTVEEYTVATASAEIGAMPISPGVGEGALLAFGGRTWQVVGVDAEARRVLVAPARGGGVPPGFSGVSSPVSDGVRQRMREVYTGTDVPRYLDEAGVILLEESRAAFRELGLAHSSVHEYGDDLLLFPWRGDRVSETLCHLLRGAGIRAVDAGVLVAVPDMDATRFRGIAARLVDAGPPEATELAALVADRRRDKYDRYLGEGLLVRAYADRVIDLGGAMDFLAGAAKS